MGTIGIIDNRKPGRNMACDVCPDNKSPVLVSVTKKDDRGQFTIHVCRSCLRRAMFALTEYNGQHKDESILSDPRKTVKPMDIRHKRRREEGKE